jgi:hypothetical protein
LLDDEHRIMKKGHIILIAVGLIIYTVLVAVVSIMGFLFFNALFRVS